jgi:hypothetical protein
MASQDVSPKTATQVVCQCCQLALFLALLHVQLVHFGLETPLLFPELFVLESLLLKLLTC